MPKSKKPAASKEKGTLSRKFTLRLGDTSELRKASDAAIAEQKELLYEPLKSGHPALHKLCEAATRQGDIEAARELVRIGILVADTIVLAGYSHENILNYIRGLYTMPIAISAIREKADLTMEIMRDVFGFGSDMPIQIHKPAGGQRFKTSTSPTQIALNLFEVFEKERLHKDDKGYSELRASVLKVKKTGWFETIVACEPGEKAYPEHLLYMDIKLLPELEGTDYATWAEVGAKVMVDGCNQIQGVPQIPAEWVAMAKKRKGKVGALRDIVCKMLESGFKSIMAKKPISS